MIKKNNIKSWTAFFLVFLLMFGSPVMRTGISAAVPEEEMISEELSEEEYYSQEDVKEEASGDDQDSLAQEISAEKDLPSEEENLSSDKTDAAEQEIILEEDLSSEEKGAASQKTQVEEDFSGELLSEGGQSEDEQSAMEDAGVEEIYIPAEDNPEDGDDARAFAGFVSREFGLSDNGESWFGGKDNSGEEIPGETDSDHFEENPSMESSEEGSISIPEGETSEEGSISIPEGETSEEGSITISEGETSEQDSISIPEGETSEEGFAEEMQEDSDEEILSSPSLRSNYASNQLRSAGRTLYGYFLEQFREIAAGRSSSTKFTITLNDLNALTGASEGDEGYVSQIVLMLEDLKKLGLDESVTSVYNVSSDGIKTLRSDVNQIMKEKIYSQYGISLKPLVKALIADCPYDLYWYDKVSSTRFSSGIYYYTDGSGVSFKGDLIFYFPVSVEYQPEQSEDAPYRTDQTIGTSVLTAAERAAAIVSENEGKTDYEKLDAYRSEILNLVSYYSTPDGTPYGNPWQLIYVFDGDVTTNVRCEGYAKAFQYLCDLSSFHDVFRECVSVTGEIYTPSRTKGEGHMWNLVLLRDGRTYLVDLTNCDTGTSGSGGGGRGLFLVGTQQEGLQDDALALSDGNVENGYLFYPEKKKIRYTFDDDTLLNFTVSDLTLAAGRVNASTTAEGEAAPTHSHIAFVDSAVEPTCTETGLTQGTHCAVCGEVLLERQTVDVLPHTPDEDGWHVTVEPTYETEGVETTLCRICGNTLERPVEKLVPVTDLTLSASSLSLLPGKTAVLSAKVLPENATDPTVTWTSDSPDIAAVGGRTGKVTAKKAGIAILKAKTNYRSIAKTVKVRVLPPATAKLSAENIGSDTGRRGITLTWKKTTGATGYVVYRGGKKIKTISSGSTVKWTDTSATTNGAKYVYRVYARASSGTSPLYRSVTIRRLNCPKITALKSAAAGSLTLAWFKNTKVTAYEIQLARKSDFSGAKTISIRSASVIKRTVKGLAAGRVYYVRIRAVRQDGSVKYRSEWSPKKKLKLK